MPRRPIESLGTMVRKKRGAKKLREAAREVGIGSATLMRVEGGRIPDLETFGKLCRWLGEDPRQFLGLDALERRPSQESEPVAIFAGHFRSDQTPKKATVDALARMMLLASRSQPRTPSEGS
jgi:transcriptional regulator with XRE-family HTH domain